MFVERHNRLFEITQTGIKNLTPNGVDAVLVHTGRRRVARLRLGRVAALLSEASSPHHRDHLVIVHLAAIESYLYRNGYCTTGHVVRILAGNYGAASEEEKQPIIRDGFPCTPWTPNRPIS